MLLIGCRRMMSMHAVLPPILRRSDAHDPMNMTAPVTGPMHMKASVSMLALLATTLLMVAAL